MPVINLDINRFRKLSGLDISVNELTEKIPWMGVDIEDVGENYVKIEYNPNRPDLGSPIGIIKSFKGIYGYEKGLIRYENNGVYGQINVEKSVEDIRPYIVGAVIKGVNMDEDTLVEIINLQEDLHNGLGRKRRRVSIGIHNLDVIKFPIRYLGIDRSFSFIPLNMDREMSIEDILKYHPTGIEYAHIVDGFERYPLLLDSEGNVLSFPPIINGEHTRVTESTRNLFLDITATDLERALQVLNVLASTLADYGGAIYAVEIAYQNDTMITPDLEPQLMTVEERRLVDYANKVLGLDLDINSIRESLERSRFGCICEEGAVKILIPPYRVDIMHLIDIVEEISVGYGFWKFEPKLPSTYSVGKVSEKSKALECISELMVGHGMTEIMNFILTNPEDQFDKMNIKVDGYIEVEKPKSREYRILRSWILPQLLKSLYLSKKEPYPHRLFEIGHVFKGYDINGEIHLAAAISHSRAGYSEAKSILDNLLFSLKVGYVVEKCDHPSFITGRVGKIYVDGDDIGLIGEFHPTVLLNYGLEQPVVGFELDISRFIGGP